MKEKILIVGAVAGGASAATRLRRLSEDYEIIMFDRGEYPSFANCGLPYHIGGIIPERESLIVKSPEDFKSRFNIDVRIFSDVIKVSPNEKTVSIQKKSGEIYEEDFDYLILSPGAKPFIPKIEGIDSDKIFTLRNIPDMDKIIKKINMENPKSVAVIGGGFIGVEMAENLKHLKLETHLIEAAPHILAPFDSDLSEDLEDKMLENNVILHLSKKVIKFEDKGEKINIFLDDNSSLTVDFVISAIGVQADTAFLKDSGISLNERGSIIVNEYLETNFENIYALGDAIPGFALAGPANRQGRIVANNIAGKKEKYKRSLGTSIIKVFDMVGASTGKNERILKQENIKYSTVIFYPNSHAGYYPNATQLHCKILFEKESGKLLGAQAVGYEAVDKFIDSIASAMHFNGTIYDLSELELCYAPPFGSAKSPVNMGGFIGRNIYENFVEVISSEEEMKGFDPEKNILLDVRIEEEVSVAPIGNSLVIPLDELRDKLQNLDKNKEIWVFCAVGLRGYIAARILIQAGYKVKNISGGYKMLAKYFKIEHENNIGKKQDECSEVFDDSDVEELNLTGLSCPGPLLSLKAKMESLASGKRIKVIASDPAFANDVQAWAKVSSNKILSTINNRGLINVLIEKSTTQDIESGIRIKEDKNNMTLIFFSGDYDKAIAAFILANGAVAMGKKVTMFFTFWGLSLLKKEKAPKVKKSFLDRMFSICLPNSYKSLPLSKMNFAGIGRKMLELVMRKKDLISLSELLDEAKKNQINMIACTMSMEAMGISENELIDGIDFGGVAQYLGEADSSNTNLFI